MKTTVSLSDFRDAFQSHDRENFSYAGQEALYDYLEEYEESAGEEVELDVIALCCDFSEYESALECAREYGNDWAPERYDDDDEERDEDEIAEELEKYCIDWLNDRTTVIAFDGGIIIQQF